jgi:hypothetical protein
MKPVRTLAMILAALLLFCTTASAESASNLPRIRQWAEALTGCPSSNAIERTITDLTDYGYRIYIYGDSIEVGFEDGTLYSYVYVNQNIYNPETEEITPLDTDSRFAILGNLLEDLSINASEYYSDCFLYGPGKTNSQMVAIILNTTSRKATYYFHYDLFMGEHTFYRETNAD